MADSNNSRTSDDNRLYDTGLFDPNVHDNQIVALYESDGDAHAARDKLVAAGLEASAVQVMNRQADPMAGGVDYEKGDQGLWGAIKGLFMPDNDAHAYNHALDKGHAMVVVTPTSNTNRHHVIEVLESTGPIDFDAKLEEWRQSGYDYSGGAIGVDNRNSADRIPADYAVNQSTVTDQVSQDRMDAQAGALSVGAGATSSSGASRPAEEPLRVGRREAAQGGSRVRSYVVERPVKNEQPL